MVIRRIAIILYVALSLVSSPSWACRIQYHPCGEESEELLTQIRLLNAVEIDVASRALNKIYTMSEKGDWNAFGILCRIKSIDDRSFDEYIMHVFSCLLSTQNFSAMDTYGLILLDLKNVNHALPFLKTAWQNHGQYDHSFENLEYNYISALCFAVSNQYSVDKQNLEQFWDLSKKYLNGTDELYIAHFVSFFEKLKLLDHERLINKVGHYIFENKVHDYLDIYTKTFEDTVHLDRLFRQRNVITFELSANLKRHEAMNQGVLEKKLRAEKFIEIARQCVKQGAIQAIGKISAHDANVGLALESFRTNDMSQISLEQKNTMALFLLAGYKHRIFSRQLMDNEEYIDQFLPTNTDKFRFLIQEVFGAL